MAILHGDTAKWPKKQAEKVYERVALMLVSAEMLVGAMLGYAGAQKNVGLGLAMCVLAVVIFLALTRWLNKCMREMGKARIWHWRGAQTEAYVAWIIRDELDNSWHLFNGVKLQQDWDIDHILVGPGGVFCISTKSQRGCFSLASDRTFLLNNKPTDFVKKAFAQTMELRTRLEALMGANTPFVQSILAAPFAYTDLAEKSQMTWILHQENLTDALEAEGVKMRLSKDQLRRAVQSVQTLADNAEKIYVKSS